MMNLIALALLFVGDLVLSEDLERCHSSTQVVIDGTHVVAFKGKEKTQADPGIWITRSKDGIHWSPPEELIQAPDADTPCWSPVFCQHPDGKVLLFYRIGATPDKLKTHVLETLDGNQFDSADGILAPNIIGPTKTKSMLTHDGAMLFASSVEYGKWTFDEKNQGFTACLVNILKSNGEWETTPLLQMPFGYDPERGGAIEGTFFRRNSNTIGMLCRNRNKTWALESLSHDEGRTWSRFVESTLPNPDSGLDILDLGDGNLIVFYNHSHEERAPFAYALSSDGGISWSPPHILIEDGGEFPSVILNAQGHVSVTYADPQGRLHLMNAELQK